MSNKEHTLYALSNPSMPGVIKIGITDNLQVRLVSLYNTSTPFKFEVVSKIVYSSRAKATKAESYLHSYLWMLRANDFELDDKLPEWVFQAFVDRNVGETGKQEFDYYVNTPEGKMYFNNGDYLIQGVHGEIYSCKPDIFEETYEQFDDENRSSTK